MGAKVDVVELISDVVRRAPEFHADALEHLRTRSIQSI